MKRESRFSLLNGLVIGMLVLAGAAISDSLPAQAQNPRTRRPQIRQNQPTKRSPGQVQSIPTDVSFEIMTDSSSDTLSAQRWGAVFRQLGISVRIRSALFEERAEVKESRRGRTRYVKAIALLKRDGSIRFPDRSFRLSDGRRLTAWIRELKTYGAQGNSAGKPGFGLSSGQFDIVFRTLEQPVRGNFKGLAFEEALAKLNIPGTMSLRFSIDAEKQLVENPPRGKVLSELNGLSRGTALSVLLNNAGMGFYPGRSPAGDLELVIVPIQDDGARWPVGWPLQRAPLHVAPKIVEVVPIELDEAPLLDVLNGIEQTTKVPILIDTWRIRNARIKLEDLTVTQPLKKMTWSGFLDRATFPALMRELVTDEAGKPFVWITTRNVKQLNERHRQREALMKQRGEKK